MTNKGNTWIVAIVVLLLCAAIFSTLWPAHLAPDKSGNPSYPLVLCINTPAGLLTYRISVEESDLFDHLPKRDTPIGPTDRTVILMALASELLVAAK